MRISLRHLALATGLLWAAGNSLQAQFQDPDCNDCNCAIGNGPLTASTLVNNLGNHDLTWPSYGSSANWTNANLFNQRFHRFYLVAGNRYTFSLCGANSYNTVMYVAQATGAALACDNDGCGDPNGPSVITFVPQISALHRLFVYDGTCGNWFVNPSPNFSLTVTMDEPNPIPAFDEPCGAVALPMSGPDCVFTTANSTAATLSVIGGTGTAPSCAGPSLLQNDVWFTTTVPPSGLIGIETSEGSICAGAFNLYTASACNGTFTQLPNSCALGSPSGPNTEPALVYDAVAAGLNVGDVVYIRYWERNGNENGTFQICAYEAQRPPNDEPCGAIVLPATLGCSFTTYSDANATPLSTVTTTPDPVTALCGGPATNDLWFAVTVTADMVANGFTVNTNAGTINNMGMTWYRLTAGSACGPGTMTQIACNNNQSGSNLMPRINSGPAGITPVLGETIYVRIWSNTPWEGTFGICATVNQPPPNNLPCGAIPLTAQYGCVMGVYSNENAFNTPTNFGQGTVAAPTCPPAWNNDVWFTVVMPPNGTIQLDTQVGSMINAGMALYSATGSCGGGNLNLTQLACQTTGSQQGPASSNMPYITYTNVGLAGQTLYVRISRQGNTNPDGNFGLCARRTDAPPTDCFYTLTLNDSGGDGWQGSFVTVCVGGVCNDYTVNGSTASINIGTNVGQTFTVSYTPVGGFQNQNSFTLSQFGQTIFNSGNAPPSGFNFVASVDCLPPPAPQEDCLGAFTLCDQSLTVNQNPQGIGNVQDLNASNRGCLSGNERQGLWYTFEAQCAGNIAFTITPTGTADYDFAVWGPFAGLTCGSALGQPLRCSWAAPSFAGAPTGLAINNLLPTTEGAFGTGFVRHITANPGDVYMLYVDNWSMNGVQFTLTWNAGNTVCPIDPVNNPTGSIIGCTILPVELVDFDAQPALRHVDISWSTASERNSAFFEVERSADGISFLPIGRVPSAGDSQAMNHYAMVDDDPITGHSFYRLKQHDKDGRYALSDLVPVHFRPGPGTLELFPNPTLGRLEVRFGSSQEDLVRWRVMDASGRLVREGSRAAHPGSNRLVLDLEALEQGSYLIELRDATGATTGVSRFVKH
jgi:hypothetical protein